MKTKDTSVRYESKYQQIAVEIAQRIVDGRYQPGERLNARSTLAGNFNVPPETARKAVNILEDLNIMEARHGSGSYVSSVEKAAAFLNRYNSVHTIQETREELLGSIARQREELEHFSSLLDKLVVQTNRAHNVAALVPYELPIPETCDKIGKTIGEMNLWHMTGATVVAIQRKGETIVSPGPYVTFRKDDILYFVGGEAAKQRMISYLFESSGDAPEP